MTDYTQEQQEADLIALGTARTKQELLTVAQEISRRTQGRSADPETLVEITSKLKCCVNAAPAPAFAVPFSVSLIFEMIKALNASPGYYVMLSSGAYSSVMGDPQIHAYMDPVTLYSRLLAGHLAIMYGMNIITDAYMHPETRILDKDCMYVMSADGSKGFAVRLA